MNGRPYQLEAVDHVFQSFTEGKKTALIVAPTGCHEWGQGILMHDGSVQEVQLVKVGDRLMGPDGKPRIVKSLARGYGDMVRIIPVKGESFVVNLDHILTLIRTNEEKPESRRSGEMIDVSVREWMKWPKWRKHIHKLVRTGVEFSPANRQPTFDPYMAGVLLGDGSTCTTVGVTTADKEIIESVNELARQYQMRVRVERAGGASNTYLIVGKMHVGRGGSKLINDLKAVGLWGERCRSKFIPHLYKRASRPIRLDLLAGLIDTDGSLSSNGYDFISASRSLSNDVAFVARSLGFAAYVSQCIKKDQNGTAGTYWRVSISGTVSEIPCRIKRKQASVRRQIKSVLRTGFSVESVGQDYYYGFSLSGDGRFLLDDFTITHNTGKTVTFALIIQRFATIYPSHLRVLVIAHREELIHQAASKIHRVIGERPDIEMAEARADLHMFRRAKVVVASKDTLRGKRLERFDPKAFGLIITDEAHHAPAQSYQSIYRYFPDALHVGVTATPDRHDEVALGKVYHDAEPFVYELPDAIRDGYLVPIKQHSVVVEGLDYSGVRTTAGDLNGRDLAEVMNNETVLQQIAAASIADAGDKRTIVFAPPGFKKDGSDCFRVSERLTEIFNRHKPDSARLVMGTTHTDDRKRALADYTAGEFQFLINVGVFTEGFDEPGIQLVVMARATKSRALYAQMIGRGTRPLPGLIDNLESADERRAAIAASAKPSLTVLDFEGNAGTHKLIHTADVLGGNYDDEVVDLAHQIAKKAAKPTDMSAALQLAAEQIRRRAEFDRLKRLHLVAKAQYSKREIDPFDVMRIEAPRVRGWDHEQPPTEKQLATLAKFGVPTAKIQNRKQAGAILSRCIEDVKAGRASYKQRVLLAKFGHTGNYSFQEASDLISRSLANQKRKWVKT